MGRIDRPVEVGAVGPHAVPQVDYHVLVAADEVVVSPILVEADLDSGGVGVVVDDVGVGRYRRDGGVQIGRECIAHP